MNKLVLFFAHALKHLSAHLRSELNYVKPQFLIDDDDEYQSALEASWDNDEKYPAIREIDDLLENHRKMMRDEEIGWFVSEAARILSNYGYRINISK